MKQFKLKNPPVCNVLGLTYEGDYIVAINGSQYSVYPKASFESDYEEVTAPKPEAPAADPNPQAPAQSEPQVKDGYTGH